MHPEDSGTAGPLSKIERGIRTFSLKRGTISQESTPISTDSADYWLNLYKGNNWVSELAWTGFRRLGPPDGIDS